MEQREIIHLLWRYGHFRNPAFLSTFGVQESDLPKLTLSHSVVRDAVRSYQDMLGLSLDRLTMNHHRRKAIHDGEIGPATMELFELPRCAMPDYGIGSGVQSGNGSWPQPCQKAGVTFSVNKASMPSSLSSRIDGVIAEVVAAYASVGLKLVQVPQIGSANINVKWRPLPGSTIGIAQFNNRSCSNSVFCDLDTGYTGLMFELLCHEMGHNCNLEHTRGGIMNPSVLDIEPHTWSKSDPSYSQLVRFFDGVPIPGPGPGPVPDPGPLPEPEPEPPPAPRRPFIEWLRRIFNWS